MASNKVVDITLRLLNGVSAPLKLMSNDLASASKQWQRTGKAIEKTGKNIQKVGKTMTTALTIPILGIATTSVKSAINFEKGMSRVESVCQGSASEMEALEAKAHKLGSSMIYNSTEVSDAYYYMALAGWNAEEMLDSVTNVMVLAGASGEDLAAVSDIVTDGITAFGYSSKDSAHFVDVLAQASRKSNTDVAQLGEAFQYVGSYAGSLGYSIDDTSIALGLMANAGVKGSKAGTSLASMFSSLSAPTSKQAKVLKELNVDLANSDGTMRPLMNVIKDLRTSTKGLTEEQRNQYASTLVGQRGMKALLPILNATDEEFESLAASIEDADGAAQNMYETSTNNLSGQLQRIKAQCSSLGGIIGTDLTPTIKKWADTIEKLVTKFSNLNEKQRKIIEKIALFTAAVGPTTMVIGKLTTGIGKLIKNIGKASGAIGRAGGIFKLITSPVGLATLAISGLVIGIILIIKNWNKIKKTNIGKALIRFGSTFKNCVKIWISYIKEIVTVISPTIKTVVGIFKGLANSISNIISGIIDILSGIIQFITGAFTGNWSTAWNGIKTIFSGVAQSIRGIFTTTINAIIGAVNGFINAANAIKIPDKNWIPKRWRGASLNISTIPYLAKGTNSFPGGQAIVGEYGPELITLPKGSKVDTTTSTQRKLNNSTQTININISEMSIREETDINKIATALAQKLKETSLNYGGVY